MARCQSLQPPTRSPYLQANICWQGSVIIAEKAHRMPRAGGNTELISACYAHNTHTLTHAMHVHAMHTHKHSEIYTHTHIHTQTHTHSHTHTHAQCTHVNHLPGCNPWRYCPAAQGLQDACWVGWKRWVRRPAQHVRKQWHSCSTTTAAFKAVRGSYSRTITVCSHPGTHPGRHPSCLSTASQACR